MLMVRKGIHVQLFWMIDLKAFDQKCFGLLFSNSHLYHEASQIFLLTKMKDVFWYTMDFEAFRNLSV